MEQSHPPYAAGSLTIPRTLNRWLDINAQNGALFRAATFITLPSFVQSVSTWNGYSDIVESFNFESPNAFSLVGIKDLVPSSPNYVACISYQTNGVVTRYLLWDATGSNLNQTLELYTSQPIKKNFRIEIWNTSQGAASQSSAIVFYTSKKGSKDYRYSGDTTLVNSDTPCVDFKCANNGTMVASQSKGSGVFAVNLLSIYNFIVGLDYTINTISSDTVLSETTDGFTPVTSPFTATQDTYYLVSYSNYNISIIIGLPDSRIIPLPFVFPSNSTSVTN